MALLLKALAIFAAAGVLAVEAKKTYVFNAFKCNTNFDLDQSACHSSRRANAFPRTHLAAAPLRNLRQHTRPRPKFVGVR